LTKTKTTIVIDGQLVKQFRDLATSKHGTFRTLNSELEEALRAFSPLEVIKSSAARLDVKIDPYPSLDEVSRNRPRVAASAGKILRQMRDERAQRVLGHQ
jgi:hypothetical protein